MIYLLDRNQIISHSVNKSEIHSALSEIAKFISLSIHVAAPSQESPGFAIKYLIMILHRPLLGGAVSNSHFLCPSFLFTITGRDGTLYLITHDCSYPFLFSATSETYYALQKISKRWNTSSFLTIVGENGGIKNVETFNTETERSAKISR